MKYQWILFDADETLFSFPTRLGLDALYKQYGCTLTEEAFQQFLSVSSPLWESYQQNEIDLNTLKRTRFLPLSEQTGVDPLQLCDDFMVQMSKVSECLDGTMETLESLHGNVKMGIITNGFLTMQPLRLTHTKTEKFFEFMLTSEEVGIPKPQKGIFEAALEKMQTFGFIDRSQVLMVGDGLYSDIAGGINAGIDTCWFNPKGDENPSGFKPTYEIQHLSELIKLIA